MAKRFNDRLTAPLPRFKDFVRILREGGFHGRGHPERAAGDVPRVSAPLPAVPQRAIGLTWIGHATYLVRIGGLNILTDPVWSPGLPGRIKRLVPPGIAWNDLPRIDAVVVSHNHYDHLDSKTVKRLPRDTAIFVPLQLGRFFRRRGFTNVTELDWWAEATLAGVSLTCVPVHHWSRRGLTDTNKTLWGGWVMQAAGRRVFFGGDTAYGKHFADVGDRFGSFDVALMPIGAYAPRWFMQDVHMDPDEAVAACKDLRAQRMATMHWGTFVLTQEPLLEPLERIRAAWAAAGRRREDLLDLAIGESRVLE
ncbi:MAG: MBL fold metallo-hydrolase [bacterium]